MVNSEDHEERVRLLRMIAPRLDGLPPGTAIAEAAAAEHMLHRVHSAWERSIGKKGEKRFKRRLREFYEQTGVHFRDIIKFPGNISENDEPMW